MTNGPPDLQREKLAATDLLGHVDAVAISGEVGDGKPNPPVFEFALDELGVEAAAAVMVGDSLSRDMAGAAALGMATIWRPSREGADQWQTTISSLSELPRLLLEGA